MSAPGWEAYLDEDETILWQGGPVPGIVIKPANIATLVFGVAFAGFALFWMIMAAQAPGGFWSFGLIHFGVGIALAVGSFLWPAWRRRHTWYTLTDKRAFIATDLPVLGRKLKSYPINTGTVLEFDAADPATIIFHQETRRTKNGTRVIQIGFERISDGAEVYKLMRQVQRGDT